MAKDLRDNVLPNKLVKTDPSDVNFVLQGPRYSLTIDKIDTDSENWQIQETEDYRPDKAEFIENEWAKDFPSQPNLSYDAICSLASRSRVVNKWLTGVNSSFAIAVAPPRWLQKEVDPQEYKKVSEDLLKFSDLAAERANEEAKAAAEYRAKLQAIVKSFDDKMAKLKTKKNLLKVLTISSTDLPITLQLAIDNFTPSAKEDAPNQRAFAREVLTSYKISLIKYMKANPNIDIQDVIDEMSVK